MTLDPDLVERVDRLAEAEGLNRSQELERLVRDAIEERETIVRAFSDPVIAKALGDAIGQPGVLRAMVLAMGEQLEPAQLQLFKKGMDQALSVVDAAQVKPRSKR